MTQVEAPRVAGAPISWGVCEVPGWGAQLPADRVFAQMSQLGLTGAEFGPEGFLPRAGRARAAALSRHGLAPVGGFVPVVAHLEEEGGLAAVADVLRSFAAAGAHYAVLAAVGDHEGYEERADLTTAQWGRLADRLDRIAAQASRLGLTAAVHPHLGTLIERPEQVQRILETTTLGLCLDTGHVLAGGGDPVDLVGAAGDRIVHVHLKDVDARVAAELRAGRLGYRDAVRSGLYVPLGTGSAHIPAVLQRLTARGYGGWYVLEQDRVLDAATATAAGGVVADMAISIACIAESVGAGPRPPAGPPDG